MNTPAFGLASLVLAVTPGPGVAYVVARRLMQGRMAGLASVTGVGRWASGSTFIGLGSERRPPDHR